MDKKRSMIGVLFLALIFVALPLVIGIASGEHPGGEPVQTIVYIEGASDLTCDSTTGIWQRDGSPAPGLVCQIGTNTCCPSDKPHCVNNVCQVAPVELPSLCAGFTTKANCESPDANPDIDLIYDIIIEGLQGNNIDFSADDVLTSNFCSDDTSVFTYETGNSCRVLAGPCGCVWMLTDVTQPDGPGNCVANWQDYEYTGVEFDCSDITDTDPDGDGNPEIDDGSEVSNFECRTSGNYEDRCSSSGIMIYRYTGQWYEIFEGGNAIPSTTYTSPACQSGERSYSCPESLEASVPFFSMVNFIITFIVVLFIYFLMKIDKKKNI